MQQHGNQRVRIFRAFYKNQVRLIIRYRLFQMKGAGRAVMANGEVEYSVLFAVQ